MKKFISLLLTTIFLCSTVISAGAFEKTEELSASPYVKTAERGVSEEKTISSEQMAKLKKEAFSKNLTETDVVESVLNEFPILTQTGLADSPLLKDALPTMLSVQTSSVYLKSSEKGIEELSKEECLRQVAQDKVSDILSEPTTSPMRGKIESEDTVDESGYMRMAIVSIEYTTPGQYCLMGACQWLKIPFYRFQDGIAIESPTCNLLTKNDDNVYSSMEYTYTTHKGGTDYKNTYQQEKNSGAAKRAGRGASYSWKLPIDETFYSGNVVTGRKECTDIVILISINVQVENTTVDNFTVYLGYSHLCLAPSVNVSYDIIGNKISGGITVDARSTTYEHWLHVKR